MIRIVFKSFAVCGVFCALAIAASAQTDQERADRERAILDLANQAREDAGLKPLAWDAALAAAAQSHAERMASEGPISHRYGGEMDLAQRAAAAGAKFSLIEENIAVGDSPFRIHQGWMKSQGHHDNMLSPEINRIGVGLVEAHGTLYAVADYSKGVDAMSQSQVEAAISKVIVAKGVTLVPYADAARAYCNQQSASDKSAAGEMKPRFLMRWSGADITAIPPELTAALASGQYKQAAVGSCPIGNQVFSGYKVAVLLY
jgi:hypothetical protein